MDSNIENYMYEGKQFLNDEIVFPKYGEKKSEEAIGLEIRAKYLFDVNQGKIELKKITVQNRVHKTIILFRLDIGGPPHSNPPFDNREPEIIYENHLHVYRDGYGDSVAYRLDDPLLQKINPTFNLEKFKTEDEIQLYHAFLEFCNVQNIPNIISNFL